MTSKVGFWFALSRSSATGNTPWLSSRPMGNCWLSLAMVPVASQPGGGLLVLGQSSYNGRIGLTRGLDATIPYHALAGEQHQLGSRLAFTPDGRHLLTGGNAGIVHILRIPNEPVSVSTWFDNKGKITQD